MGCFRSCVSGLAVAACMGFSGNSGPHAEEVTPTLGISGFFDVNAGPVGDRDNPFALGPFELDLESTLSERISGSAAIVYQDDAAEIGVGFVDLHFFNEGQSSTSPRGRIFSDPGYHVQIGQFDIPFGLDYLLYATPDRPTITPPLSTELVFEGGWTDVGLRMFKAHPMFNVSAYMVNGFDEGYAAGGRIGVRPFTNPFSAHVLRESPLFEIGFSGAIDLGRHSSRQRSLAGMDMEINVTAGRMLGEFVVSRNHDTNTDQRSWYIMAVHPVQAFGIEIISRFEEYESETDDEPDKFISRATLGFSKSLFDIIRLKAEYNRLPHGAALVEERRDSYSIQAAITF